MFDFFKKTSPENTIWNANIRFITMVQSRKESVSGRTRKLN